MTTSSGRKHAGPGLASDQPPVREPTVAERARKSGPLGQSLLRCRVNSQDSLLGP